MTALHRLGLDVGPVGPVLDDDRDSLAVTPTLDGCRPLEARVITDDDTVSWMAFTQPHRRERDCTAFEPIAFSRAQYVAAVASTTDLLTD